MTTTTKRTVTQYLKRALQLQCSARKDLGVPPSANLVSKDLVEWAIARRPTLARATWRQYKASIRCSLSQERTPQNREALAKLEGADASPCKRITRNTSSQKDRALKPADFKAIRDYLLQTSGKWARATAVWLAAGTITGLRPAEWRGTQLIEESSGKRTLAVPNGKATNGRANGFSRSLDLSDLEPGLVSIVKRHLAFVRAFPSTETYHRAYKSCRKTLYIATRRLWPNRETFTSLYTARHQFAANAKAGGLSRPEVAALLGHASDATAALHYSRRKLGHAGFRIRANPAEVALVKRNYESRADHIARKTHSAAPNPSPTPTR